VGLSTARARLARSRALRRLLARLYGGAIVDTERSPGDRVRPGDLDESGQYQPSGWFRLRVALPKRAVAAEDVFVDIGSGKGRVVVQAAMHYRFKRVIGVELVEHFTQIARANVERNRIKLRTSDVQLITADALEWEIPEDVTIVYMYNPLMGGLFMRFVERLIGFVDRRQRGVRLIYVNPIEHDRLVATGRVSELPPPRGLLALLRGTPPSEMRRYEIKPMSG
jgi:hypothetical protein